MNNIHPTAIVSGKARLGDNITISPYAIVEDDVEIGNDCEIGPNAVIYNGARIADRVQIKQGAAVSNVPQDLKYDGEEAYFYIGEDTVVREFATLHRGTKETGFSRVGKNCLLMAFCHIAHDVVVGDNCVIANSCLLAGHAVVEDYVIIGGITPVHQFCKVGQHSMIGGGFRIVKDVPPYILAGSEPLKYAGVNSIGLNRRGFSSDDIMTLKKTYTLLYNSGLNFSDAIKKIAEEFGEHNLVQNVVEFIKKSDRGIIGR
ncbi:MAG: acyl-ACP--UDP-N-acetylglucosamine O-acyltransferase [Ignavibacteriaceae bacterium]|jgi:UDP-N-acetylglucosamine acyltransferase